MVIMKCGPQKILCDLDRKIGIYMMRPKNLLNGKQACFQFLKLGGKIMIPLFQRRQTKLNLTKQYCSIPSPLMISYENSADDN